VMTIIHGPLLAGDVLVNALGYGSSGALRQASLRKMVPVTLFDIPERKFKYALSVEVAHWLVQQRVANCSDPFDVVSSTIEPKSAQFKLFILDHGYLLLESDLIRLLGLESRSELIQKQESEKLPFGLFRIDHRQTKLFALAIEAFQHLG